MISEAFLYVMVALIAFAGWLSCWHYDRKFVALEHKFNDDYATLRQHIRLLENGYYNDGK